MNDQISVLLAKRWVVPASVGIAAFSGGIGLGYILGIRRSRRFVEQEFDKYLTLKTPRVISSSEYRDRYVDQDEDVEKDLYEEPKSNRLLVETIDEVEPVTASAPETKPEPLHVNVFENNVDDWDHEAELSTRTDQEPYIIHQDEYFADDVGFHQSTITYYEGDDILVDEQDVPIYNHTSVVGELRFGHGSKDPNVLYVRNERLKGEYEILRSKGHYAVEVLGHQIEQEYEEGDLKHSLRKFNLD